MIKERVRKEGNTINILIKIHLFQEDGMWVTYCPALELSSYGDDENDAKAAFDEALGIFISETTRKGTLEKCLLQLGWTLRQKPKVTYTQPTTANSLKIIGKGKMGKIYNEKIAVPVN